MCVFSCETVQPYCMTSNLWIDAKCRQEIKCMKKKSFKENVTLIFIQTKSKQSQLMCYKIWQHVNDNKHVILALNYLSMYVRCFHCYRRCQFTFNSSCFLIFESFIIMFANTLFLVWNGKKIKCTEKQTRALGETWKFFYKTVVNCVILNF